MAPPPHPHTLRPSPLFLIPLPSLQSILWVRPSPHRPTTMACRMLTVTTTPMWTLIPILFIPILLPIPAKPSPPPRWSIVLSLSSRWSSPYPNTSNYKRPYFDYMPYPDPKRHYWCHDCLFSLDCVLLKTNKWKAINYNRHRINSKEKMKQVV